MEEALIKRVLPHNTEAEQLVIGCMLMDKEAISAASEIIHSDDFYATSMLLQLSLLGLRVQVSNQVCSLLFRSMR